MEGDKSVLSHGESMTTYTMSTRVGITPQLRDAMEVLSNSWLKMSSADRSNLSVHITNCVGDGAMDRMLHEIIMNDTASASIPFEVVRSFVISMNMLGFKYSIHGLLLGSIGFVELEEEPPLRPPELDARLAKIQRHLDQKDYNDLVKNVDGVYKSVEATGEISKDIQEAKRSLSLATNLLFTVVGMFAFGYACASHFSEDPALTVLSGTLCAAISIIAELWFILIPNY